MPKYQNAGSMTLDFATVGGARAGVPMTMDANGIASGQAFLESELEKKDTLLKEPLSSVTYPRDVNIRVGGGFDEFVSSVSVDYGVTGGSGDGIIGAGAADGVPMIQANFDKDLFKTHLVTLGSRIFWVDMQRGNITGRSIETVLRDGVRLAYDKHMDANLYVGFTKLGTTGLVNNAGVTAITAANGGGGTPDWASKTPDEILADINGAIIDVWTAAGNDLDAIPNHILLPYKQYNQLVSTKVSSAADKSVLQYLLDNNIAKQYGVDLFIGATNFCSGAGTGSTDRMVVYVNKERFVAMDELSPLNRAMTTPNAEKFSYDTVYAANVSEAELFYLETAEYVDGI